MDSFRSVDFLISHQVENRRGKVDPKACRFPLPSRSFQIDGVKNSLISMWYQHLKYVVIFPAFFLPDFEKACQMRIKPVHFQRKWKQTKYFNVYLNFYRQSA